MGLPIRYAGWMGWDLVRGPGLLMLIVGALAALLINSLTVVTSGSGGETAVFLGILDFTVTIFALLATAGIVSTDFSMGYYRPLFARPVSPPLYYLQRWVLGGFLALVVTAAVTLASALRLGADLPIGRVRRSNRYSGEIWTKVLRHMPALRGWLRLRQIANRCSATSCAQRD